MIGTTVVFVVYGTEHLDLDGVPADHHVVVVHNDDRMTSRNARARVRHIEGHGNVGFGAGANVGLRHVTTPRVVFCNPDTRLDEVHWDALSSACADEIVSVPLVDFSGGWTSVVNAYPGPLTAVLMGFRVGRLFRRGSVRRRVMQRALGHWGAAHARSSAPGVRPLREAWCSGAVVSVDVGRVRTVGGFDERFFLYFEDVDLCRRLAERFPAMTVRIADTPPAQHAVGGSVTSVDDRRVVDWHVAESALQYAESLRGSGWNLARAILAARVRWLRRR